MVTMDLVMVMETMRAPKHSQTDGHEGGDGEAQGLEVQPGQHGPEHDDGNGVEIKSKHPRPGPVVFQGDGDLVNTRPGGPEQGAPAHHRGGGPEGGHRGADGQQCGRSIVVKRKYRLPDGATRDSKTQLGILNFTFKSGRGDISAK